MSKKAIDERSGHVTNELEKFAELEEDRKLFPPEKFESILTALNKVDRVNANIPVSLIIETENIRRSISGESEQDLSEVIKKEGLNQHPVVTIRKSENGNFQFVMVGGHRRLAAFKQLGYRTIPCTVRKFSNEKERLLASYSENQNRKEMDIFDLATSFEAFKNAGMDLEEISKVAKLDITNVRRYLHLNNWLESTVSIVRKNREILPIKFLFKYASKKHLPEEIEKEILKKIALAKTISTDKKPTRVSGATKNFQSIKKVVESKKLPETQIKLISDILVEASILKQPLI